MDHTGFKPKLEREQVPIEQMLVSLLQRIPMDDGLRYCQSMYDSLNPALISYITGKSREQIKSMSIKRGTKEADIYFTIGGDSWSKSLFVGFISAILWIEDYILSMGETYKVSTNERKIFSDVLRKMHLPTIMQSANPKNAKYGASTYAQILANFVVWLSRASIANKANDKITRSNREVVECLTSTALDSFPAIPFTAYHLGTVKADESSIRSIAESLSADKGWRDYLSEQFIAINEPKFVVTASTAPIVGIIGHPLCSLQYGANDNGTIQWITSFANSPEFERLCTQKGIAPNSVREYVERTSAEKYKQDIESGVMIAKMLDQQKITPEIFVALKPTKSLVE